MGQHHRHCFIPPGQAAQIGLRQREVPAGQVHFGQGGADGRAVGRCGREFTVAAQLGHYCRWFTLDLKYQFAARVGTRLGHRDAALGQVFHQTQIKRQLFQRESLEQGQHVIKGFAIALGADKIIGVFDAPGAALHGCEFTQFELSQQGARLLSRDFCVNRHESETQNFPAALTAGRFNLIGGQAPLGLNRDGFGFAANAQLINACARVFDLNTLGALFNHAGCGGRRSAWLHGRPQGWRGRLCQREAATRQREGKKQGDSHRVIVERAGARSGRRQNGRMNMNDSLNDAPAKPKILLLVDGSSYLYRAFHAMPDLRAVPGDSQSAPTGAIRGMINMLQSLRKEVPADFAACVFDAKGPTFRDDLYPEYKAHRSPMPDDLRAQIEPIHEVVRLMGWKVLDVPGVEADDVIGTLAVIAAKQGIEVIVSSGDKDLAQLVNAHITIIDTMNGKRRDLAGVEAEFGVPPQLMVDFQTLVGDVIDNVPGVPKVGPKTAARWLQQYGSLDAVVAHAEDIAGAVGENLKKSLDWLPLGRQLLTIKTDCELNGWVPDLPALDSIATGAVDTAALAIFYDKYGFKGLARAIGGNGVNGIGVRASFASLRGSDPNSADSNSGFKTEPDMFDEPEESASPAASSVTTLAYDTVLTWDAFDHWLARVHVFFNDAADTE